MNYLLCMLVVRKKSFLVSSKKNNWKIFENEKFFAVWSVLLRNERTDCTDAQKRHSMVG